MKKQYFLNLEQLEDRIFLDANPVMAVDLIDPAADPAVDQIVVDNSQLQQTAAADPVAIDPMIGENFTFTVGFDNTTGSNVYGPYIDLLLDGGKDDNDTGTVGDGNDGITFVSANYLGADVEATVVTITTDGEFIDHPYATDNAGNPLQINSINGQTFRAGDQFVSLLMPFGSFTPDQPEAVIEVTAHMGRYADVDSELTVHTTTGAMFGHDALDNPGTDNPLRDITTGSSVYKAEVITYNKDIIVQNVAADCQEQHDPSFDDTRQYADDPGQTFEVNHQEIPTGPNFPATYVATIDIAEGQTVSGLSLTDHLPDNIVYIPDTVEVKVHGMPAGHSISQVGSDLTITLDDDVDGTSVSDDVVITYDFYVPDQTSGGADIIDPSSGDDAHVINDGEVAYSFVSPDNPAEDTNATIDAEVNADGHFSSNPNVDDISHAQSIAIQKAHAIETDTGHAGYTPGDMVKFTLDFQISDYFSFGNIIIDDLLPDGMDLVPIGHLFAPQIQIFEGGTELVNRALTGSELTAGVNGDHDETLRFNISQVLINEGNADGLLEGGYTHGNAGGATYGTITYWAVIQQHYQSPIGGGEDNVDQGDNLSGGVTITGDIYDDSGNPTGSSGMDESCDSIDIVTGEVAKDIYAITHNGVTTYFPGNNPHLSPGDTVTYRLQYDMPLSSTESFKLTDYLPLPVFDVNDPDQDGNPNNWTFNATAFDGTNAPAAGEWGYTTSDTYHILDPTVTVSAGTDNTLVFDYGACHDSNDTTAVIDIVFTITVSNEPFADGMFLTNQVRATEQGTALSDINSDAIVQVVVDEPELNITKGVVQTSNDVADATTPAFSGNGTVDNLFTEPGTAGFRSQGGTVISSDWLAINNIDTSLVNVDAGDIVTMAIVVENTGHSDAFDVTITDVLPTGYVLAGGTGNMQITDGTGAPVTWTGASGSNVATDLFNGGITFDDVGGVGGLSAHASGAGDNTGNNIFVITYDLELLSTVGPDQVLTNTATITNYAGAEGATDHTTQDISDDAVVTTTQPVVVKELTDTGETSTTGNNVVIGETVEYTVTITVPEGEVNDFKLIDNLDAGLAMVSIDSIDVHPNLTTTVAGGWAGVLAAAQNNLAAPGTSFTMDFGNVTNTTDTNDTDETITVTYTAVVLNVSANQQGTHLDNNVHVSWDNPNGGTDLETADVHSQVVVQEADLQILKEVWNGTSWVDANDSANAVNLDQGDEIRYRFTVEHSANSHADAFDAVFTDSLPVGINWSNATINMISDTAGVSGITLVGGTISAQWDEILSGQSTVFEVAGGTFDTATAGQGISNTGEISWESLESDLGTAISTYNDNSWERTGDPADPGAAANDYNDSDVAIISVAGAINKVDPVQGSYTIGDTVTYTIHVTVPDGTTENLVVNDALPSGMIYVDNSVSITPGTFSGTLNTAPTVTVDAGDGGDVHFAFGNVSADAGAGSVDNTFTITFDALVTDIPGNHGDPDGPGGGAASTLTNHVSMQYDDPDNPGSTDTVNDPTDPTITVVEPQITTEKTVADSADAGTDASPGETMTYTVRFTNTGTSTAYEVNALDTLPTGVEFVALSSAQDNHGNDLSNSTSMTDNGNGTVSVIGNWDIGVNDWVEIQYTVTVMAAGFTAGSYGNTIDADWSSQDGDDPNEQRIYDDTASSPVDGDLDDDDAVFTVFTTASLGGTVVFDADNSGSETAGDVGISGVKVTITADVDNDGTPEFTRTVTTDADGNYIFTNLAAFDNYTVTVDYNGSGGSPFNLQGAGYHETYDLDGTGSAHVTAGIALTAGQNRGDVDFGYTGQNSAGDTVWFDVDADGVQDAGEDGIGGLTVTLTADIDGDGVEEYTATTITDGHGQYGFDYLPAGDFNITVTPPAGTTPTYDKDGGIASPDNTTPFSLGADKDRDDIDFGLRGTGSIGDFIWYDADGLGDQNETTGIGGVTITLRGDIDGDGTIDYTTTATTANDGSYLFDNLLGGDYTITVDNTTLPAGMIQTFDLDDGTGPFTTAHASTVTLVSGANCDDMDFGYIGSGVIGDTIYFDTDGNGIQDSGENGMPGVDVTISVDFNRDGIPDYTETITSDANGNYSFDNLPAGVYTVTIDPATLPDDVGPSGDPDGTLDNSAIIGLGPGEINNDQDFGYTGTGSIGGFIWYDADGLGDQNEGAAAGIGGVTVTLTGDIDGDGTIDYTTTATTADDGSYLFDNLLGGDYTVTVAPSTIPGGMNQTADPDGNFDNASNVTLNGGADRLGLDFGYTGTGTIGGRIWNDVDGNGTQDGSEGGMANVDVTLAVDYDNDGNVDYTMTTTTDASGSYSFDNLSAGEYTIEVDTADIPANYVQTGDPDANIDNQATVVLNAGETNIDQDFGYSEYIMIPSQSAIPEPVEWQLGEQGEEWINNEPYFRLFDEILWVDPIFPVSPIYTGHAEPGTTLQIVLYDALGEQIGQQSIMADTAGNWLASFPGTLMFDYPHRMEIQQTASSYNMSTAGFFNMRVFYNPNFSSMVFSSARLDVETVFAYLPSTLLDSIHMGNLAPLNLEWNNFDGYEFVAPPTHPGRSAH